MTFSFCVYDNSIIYTAVMSFIRLNLSTSKRVDENKSAGWILRCIQVVLCACQFVSIAHSEQLTELSVLTKDDSWYLNDP